MTIENCRNEIDKIDDEIAKLFSARMDVARRIAKFKSEEGKIITDNKREDEIISRVCSLVKDEYDEYCKQLFVTLFYISKDYQKNLIDGKIK